MDKNKELVLKLLRAHDVAYKPDIAKALGSVTAALFLSRLLQWWDYKSDPDWLYKTQKEMFEETGLSRHEQDSARKKLRQAGLLEEARRGLPAKVHYKINFDALYMIISQHFLQDHIADQNAEIRQTENTAPPENLASESSGGQKIGTDGGELVGQFADIRQTRMPITANQDAEIRQSRVPQNSRPDFRFSSNKADDLLQTVVPKSGEFYNTNRQQENTSQNTQKGVSFQNYSSSEIEIANSIAASKGREGDYAYIEGILKNRAASGLQTSEKTNLIEKTLGSQLARFLKYYYSANGVDYYMSSIPVDAKILEGQLAEAGMRVKVYYNQGNEKEVF